MNDSTRSRPKVRDDIAEMAGYHSPQVDVAVRLNTNEAPEAPPDEWRAELADAMSRLAWNRYPDRSATDLRTAIGQQYGVGPERVFAANGSNECLQTICLAFGGVGRTAALFEPTYRMHSQIASVCQTGLAFGDRNEDFSLDLAAAKQTITDSQANIVFLCSPNNPTGMLESRETVEEVLDLCRTHGALLVMDEAYGQFASWSATEMVDDDQPLVVSRTFSKTWSMAGARLGYLIAPEWAVAEFEKVILPYHLDAAKQLAGTLALKYAAQMKARVDRLVSERIRIAEALAALPVRQWPSEANFILFRPNDDQPAGPEVWQGLLDREVLVRDTSSWPRLGGALRVTVGTPDENDRFIAALSEVLS